MPIRKTPLVNGEYYHIYNRGINKQEIFLSTKYYRRALETLKFYFPSNPPTRYSQFVLLGREHKEKFLEITEKQDKLVDLISYCLMPNHFHLLLKQNVEKGISNYIRKFQISYTRYFNTRRDRDGPLLKGSFRAIRIEDENQLLHVNRYIHLNPYTSYVVSNIDDLKSFPWSSLQEYLGVSKNKFCQKEVILSNFKILNNYSEFVLNQADYQKQLDKIKHLTFE